MRHRIVDAALLLGLVAVAGGIMWTLFNLGGSPRQVQPAPASPAAVEPASPAGDGAVVPVAPGSQVEALDPDDGAPGGAAEPIAPQLGGEPGAEEPEAPAVTAPAQVPAAEAPPVPPGTVELTRLGFSFVTGGPGACGVVLEPWTHVAVSRELLAAYGCGARVRITLDDPAGGIEAFEGVVGDTMNPQFSRTVNVYVAEDEPALEYGVTTGSITPLD